MLEFYKFFVRLFVCGLKEIGIFSFKNAFFVWVLRESSIESPFLSFFLSFIFLFIFFVFFLFSPFISTARKSSWICYLNSSIASSNSSLFRQWLFLYERKKEKRADGTLTRQLSRASSCYRRMQRCWYGVGDCCRLGVGGSTAASTVLCLWNPRWRSIGFCDVGTTPTPTHPPHQTLRRQEREREGGRER